MGRLDDKVVVVTGGTTGIGAAAARLFRDEGATVIATGSNPKTLEAAKSELTGVEVLAADQADVAATQALLDDVARRHGRIDHLFVNAGVAQFAPLEASGEALFDRQFNINVRGAYFTARSAAPHIPEGGSILFTASNAAHMGMPGASVYSATKAAVRSFARSFAAELAPRNVRVNVVSPGPIETPIFGKGGFTPEQAAGFKAQITAQVPLKRIGAAEEIAKAALFLLADATFSTGSELIADGGLVEL